MNSQEITANQHWELHAATVCKRNGYWICFAEELNRRVYGIPDRYLAIGTFNPTFVIGVNLNRVVFAS